jgi:hypothetical protein
MDVEYAKDLLDGNAYWFGKNGQPELQATLMRLYEEIDTVPDLDELVVLTEDYDPDRLYVLLDKLHRGLESTVTAAQYVEKLAAVHNMASVGFLAN